MADLLAELFSIEADFAPDVEKQIRGLSVLVAGPPGRACVFVAEWRGMVVGMATVPTLVSTAEVGRVGLVEDLVVDAGFRSQGIGRRLLEKVITWSRNADLTRLQLLAYHANAPALRFYQNAGWDRTGMICLRKLVCPS
jgi:GNAT superfamily N-acetyltransferase